MKIIKFPKTIFSFLISTLFLFHSTNAYSFNWGWWKYWFYQPPQKTITDIVVESGGTFDNNPNDFDLLLNAVLAVELEGFLDDASQDLTVFAPNDKAFIRLANDLGYEGNDEEGAFNTIVAALTEIGGGDLKGILTTVLTYHVAPESLRLWEVYYSSSLDTLAGGFIVPWGNRLIDAEPELKDPRFSGKTDIKASNGFVHTIDRVLIPADLDNTPEDAKNLVEIVAASGEGFDRNYYDYDVLLKAVQTAGLADVLTDAEDITVLLPIDAAFVRLARNLGYHGYREDGAFDFIVQTLTTLGNGDPLPLLTQILQYHVLPETKTVTDIVDAEPLMTLLPEAKITPDGRRLMDLDPGVRDPWLLLWKSNIRGSNGIAHSISRVLLPVAASELL